MKTKNLVLELVADHIDMLLCHSGQVLDGRRIAVALDSDPARWSKTVKDTAKAVGTAALEMGAVGAPTQVLYRSPTECVDYASLTFKSQSEAQQAAILGCAESLACPLDLAVCEAMVIGRDASGAQPQSHVVVAADSDDAVCAIAAMVEDAGLKFVSATPIDAANMAKVAGHALQTKDQNHGYLYVGAHRSFFAIAGEGCLRFARPMSLGSEALVSSLTKPIRTSNGTTPIELRHETARELLHRFGFPDRKAVVNEQLGLTGVHILPLLQPVLQRCIVELRQSLRFALPENERQSIALTITGPASAIPGFASIVAKELNLTATADERYSRHDWQKPGSEGSELTDAISDPKILARLGLQPQVMARARSAGKLRRLMWTGAVAALLVIAVDAVRFQSRLVDARSRAAVAASQDNDLKALQGTTEKLISVVAAMDKLEAGINKEVGSRIDLSACMRELSRLTPESIRMSSIGFRQLPDQAKAAGTLNGYAMNKSAGGEKKDLETFIGRLGASPLFESAALKNVQVGNAGSAYGQQFSATMTGILCPREQPPKTASVSVDAGAKP